MRRLQITKVVYAGGIIQFNFAFIQDRINPVRTGRIKFDTCYIR